MKYKKDKATYKDPVCGMEVSRISAIAEAHYQGKTYYFCAGICKDAFLDNPEKYLKGCQAEEERHHHHVS